MPRYKLIIEYDGTNFVGWQRQKNGPSIQQSVEEAVAAFSGETVVSHAAGRTDAGVHALAMVAHIDLVKPHEAATVRDAINYHLRPAPIATLAAVEVSEDFHARFSCIGRAYEYRILNRRPPLALDADRVWRITQDLDADRMHKAAQALVGRHDFSTFRAAACQASTPVKTFNQIDVSRAGDEVIVRCSARSFLHNQVRSIAGSLVEVGSGKWTAQNFKDALDAADRSRCGPVAPPEGLYFRKAMYTDE